MASRPSGEMMPSLMSLRGWHGRDVRLHHRARVEGGDLVVVAVGHDHGLRGVGVVDLAHELGV
jgi:hypothetical protein